MAVMNTGLELLIILIIVKCAACDHVGDPVMFLPPFEVRTVKDNRPTFLPFVNTQLHSPQQLHSQQQLNLPQQLNVPQQLNLPQQLPPPVTNQNKIVSPQHQLTHTTQAQVALPTVPTPAPRIEKHHDAKKSNFSFEEFVEALNDIAEHKENENQDVSRAAGHDYDYPHYLQYSRPPVYGYAPRQPSYGSPSIYQEPGTYHESSSHAPSTSAHHTVSKLSLLKPDFGELTKPVTTKAASKASSLISLGLALISGLSSDTSGLKGVLDLVINGIVKPMLVAKGGIKTLISKLSIPVISLLLINLEVLITVWWMWDDCPEQTYSPPSYSYSKPANAPTYVNSYR